MATQHGSPEATISATDDAATRRAKKRELDRRAQRAARERNRNRIAYLEATIQAMSEQESNSRIANLMNQLADMTRQRDNLEKVLSSIETSIQVHREGKKVESSTRSDQASQPLNVASDPQDWPDDHAAADILAMNVMDDVVLDDFTPDACTVTWGLPVPDTAVLDFGTATEFSRVVQGPSSLTLPGNPNLESFPKSASPPSARHLGPGDGVIVPEPDSACECLASRHDPGTPGVPSTTSIWRYANEALGAREMLSTNVLALEDEMNEHIPIRVILEGWDAVERSEKLPPLWKKLRRTDSLQFRNCPNTERLAILRLMHRLLRYQAEATVEQCAKLPAWYLSRPSQSLPHSSAIDFFVWPGVRERFVFSQHQYCSNLFWKVFADSFRIMWPFEFRDCYRRNVETGRYCMSPEFEQRIQNINSWTMSTDFFNHFPEMYSDIPVYQEIPKPLGWKENTLDTTRKRRRVEDTATDNAPRSRRRSSGVGMTATSTFHDWSFGDFPRSNASDTQH
ncbi:bZIP transcription factor [Colletotrichum truncatum]|uniref:BZIP transcription factor n=1 Tax=Colletotrichum truncatum TaxID=5467 RepID=A0ACC3YUM7_COLTU|nr:bZIP transcription factor [Colletotrichum truncatum]KAF6785785.1 bZIP transcription factor [Colletotrichum truncatum]